MEFTRFLLETYMETAEGKNTFNFFINLPQLLSSQEKRNEVINFINKRLIIPIAEDSFNFDYNIIPVTYRNFNEFENDVKLIIYKEYIQNNDSYRECLEDIPYISLLLYTESQQYAFPYLYPFHFHKLQDICNILGIVLPNLPGKKDYKGKFLYYIELCQIFHDFRIQYELSTAEFCVLIYGFMEHFINKEISQDLPAPLKSYIVGANSGIDHKFLQTISSSSIRNWQGNIDTQIGDIILMYELAPQSYISSIYGVQSLRVMTIHSDSILE